MAYPSVISAVSAIVVLERTKFFEELKSYILSNVDDDSSEALKDMFTSFEDMHLSKTAKTTKEEKIVKTKRAPSDYNRFVGEKIKELRASDTSLSAKDAMQQAMVLWKQHKSQQNTITTTINPIFESEPDTSDTSDATLIKKSRKKN